MTEFRGVLAQAKGELFGDKVFYLRQGLRHWVSSAEWVKAAGFEWPSDVRQIDENLLLAFAPGQPVPMPLSSIVANTIQTTVYGAREAALSTLSGTGIEIGAYASPLPAPLHCVVQYGDMYTYEELIENAYAGQALHDIVRPTIKTELDTLQGIGDESVDFIAACHVIEHTYNPIRSIKTAFEKLRPGGALVLVVPDKERTFDRKRPVTPLAHLIADFEAYTRDRDQEHFREFYSLAEGFSLHGEEFEETWKSQWEAGFPIHFHTWTYASFMEMADWLIANAAPFRRYWSHPTVDDGIEFYFRFEK